MTINKFWHRRGDLGGTCAFGATVADYWGERGEKDNAKVACEVDADRFFKLMFDLLRG